MQNISKKSPILPFQTVAFLHSCPFQLIVTSAFLQKPWTHLSPIFFSHTLILNLQQMLLVLPSKHVQSLITSQTQSATTFISNVDDCNVLICYGCPNKYYRLGGLMEIYCLTSLEARNLSSGCWQSCFFLRLLFLGLWVVNPFIISLCFYFFIFLGYD